MSKKLTVLAGLLLAVAVTAYSVSGTYAKYTSSVTLSDSARVAKWDIKLGSESLWSASTTFNIFDYTDANVDVDGSGSETVIAPGTTGTITLPKITNNSEVKASYSIDLSVTNTSGIPLEFSTDGTNWYTSTNIASASATGTLAMGDEQTTATTIQWRWVYENGTGDTLKTNDGTDTGLGKTGTATVELKATVTATQVD